MNERRRIDKESKIGDEETMKIMRVAAAAAIAVGICTVLVLAVYEAKDEREAVVAPTVVWLTLCMAMHWMTSGAQVRCKAEDMIMRLYDHMKIIPQAVRKSWRLPVRELLVQKCFEYCRCGSDMVAERWRRCASRR